MRCVGLKNNIHCSNPCSFPWYLVVEVARIEESCCSMGTCCDGIPTRTSWDRWASGKSISKEDNLPPNSAIILFNWSISDVPGMRGLRRNISAKVQPKLHTSWAVSYSPLRKRISGAQYHRLPTHSHKESLGSLVDACVTAIPKSHNFTWIQSSPFLFGLFNNIFAGLISRCIISNECK